MVEFLHPDHNVMRSLCPDFTVTATGNWSSPSHHAERAVRGGMPRLVAAPTAPVTCNMNPGIHRLSSDLHRAGSLPLVSKYTGKHSILQLLIRQKVESSV